MSDSRTTELEVRPEKFEVGKWFRPYRNLPSTGKHGDSAAASYTLEEKGRAIHFVVDDVAAPGSVDRTEVRKLLTVIVDGYKEPPFTIKAKLKYLSDLVYISHAVKVDDEIIYQDWEQEEETPTAIPSKTANPFSLENLDLSQLEILVEKLNR